MDVKLVQKLNLDLSPIQCLLEVHALDNRIICLVTHQTQPFSVRFLDGHSEELCFHAYKSDCHLLILGHPWLQLHNPHINWNTGEVQSWVEECASVI